jgi:hypothetical protein
MVRWVGDIRHTYINLLRKPEEKRSLENHVLCKEDNIKIVTKENSVRVWTGFNWPRIGAVAGLL